MSMDKFIDFAFGAGVNAAAFTMTVCMAGSVVATGPAALLLGMGVSAIAFGALHGLSKSEIKEIEDKYKAEELELKAIQEINNQLILKLNQERAELEKAQLSADLAEAQKKLAEQKKQTEEVEALYLEAAQNLVRLGVVPELEDSRDGQESGAAPASAAAPAYEGYTDPADAGRDAMGNAAHNDGCTIS